MLVVLKHFRHEVLHFGALINDYNFRYNKINAKYLVVCSIDETNKINFKTDACLYDIEKCTAK
jgi:hypothetical protein